MYGLIHIHIHNTYYTIHSTTHTIPPTLTITPTIGDKAQQLAGILTASNRGHVVQRLYLEARLAPLMSAWEQFTPTVQGGFASWLPGFYDEVCEWREGGGRCGEKGGVTWAKE